MPDREVIRCPWCNLNQYITASGLCRKPECGKPLKPALSEVAQEAIWQEVNKTQSLILTPFYCPDKPFSFLPPRVEAVLEKQIVPAFNTAQIVADIVSNVRRKKKQPRYVAGYLLVPNFPTDLRLKLLDYAQSKNMTMRDVVVKSLEKYLDRE